MLKASSVNSAVLRSAGRSLGARSPKALSRASACSLILLACSACSAPEGDATGAVNDICSPSRDRFSFFVTSQRRLFALAEAFNGSQKGFGGDLRYGETADDAGLRGADKICTAIAEQAVPDNCKIWRAFLSTSTVNAIERIGTGPWYDASGNLFGNDPQEILALRPPNAAATIINDFPNEDGIPNHDALQLGDTQNQDNHDILTGTGEDGKRYTTRDTPDSTCRDWTSLDTTLRPRVGHSWPRPGMQHDILSNSNMNHWISSLNENGCAPGYNLSETSTPRAVEDGGDGTVGGAGGYGAIYCFALTP